MKLRELKDVIQENSRISLQTLTDKGKIRRPLYYESWNECKENLKDEDWDQEVTLSTYVHDYICILFINL